MNHQVVTIILAFFILTLNSCAQNNSAFTKSNIQSINTEINESFLKKDLTVIEKYLFEGTEIFIDLDPKPNTGEEQIDIKEYRELMKISMMFIEDMTIEEEIISIDIDEQKDEATLVTKAQISSDIMGVKTTEETISTTVFGRVNGEIKILKTSDQLLSIDVR